MTDTPNPPEGWYPDPAGSGGLRRWDGASWTAEVRPAGPAQDAAVPAETPAEPVSVDQTAPVASITPSEPSAPAEPHTPAAPVEPHTPAGPEAPAAPEAPTAPEAPVAPEVPVAPVAPAAPVVPPVPPVAPGGYAAAGYGPGAPAAPSPVVAPAQPGYGAAQPGDVPTQPGVGSAQPGYPAAPGSTPVPGYPGAPAYASAPQQAYAAYPGGVNAPVRHDIPTSTVWIWLIVALPLVSVLSLFLFDWRGLIEQQFYEAAYAPRSSLSSMSTSLSISAVSGLIAVVTGGLTVLFAFLDWRTLRQRGIDKPFHWAWSFFVFIVSSGVYIIGRGVILRRQTGKGLTPIWVWIGVVVLSFIVAALWAVALFRDIFAAIPTYGY